VATKKQQRRRDKERRHEYEVVYVDEEGNEVEAPPDADKAPAKSDRAGKGKQPAGGRAARGSRPVREVKPPSWSRVARRAVLFAPLLFVALSIGKHPPAIAVRLLIAIGYTALFMPTFYWIDRFAYRRYLRSTGAAPDAPAKK
jgi:hypothetical protein